MATLSRTGYFEAKSNSSFIYFCTEQFYSSKSFFMQAFELGPAMKTYFLSSAIPYSPSMTHTLKNKEFYKPDQFIWNNPHRTSKKIYNYYHKSNDEYQRQVKPRIKKMEEDDRLSLEQGRIRRLSKTRQETRSKFYSRQKAREDIQMKSGSRARYRFSATPSSKRLSSEPQIFPSDSRNKVFSKTLMKAGPMPVSKTEQSFQKGLESYDRNQQEMYAYLEKQSRRMQQDIREKFISRKGSNDLLNSRYSRTFPAKKIPQH